jgi:hypothetical protein
MGIIDPIGLIQVRKAIKSSIIEPLGTPMDLFACFRKNISSFKTVKKKWKKINSFVYF